MKNAMEMNLDEMSMVNGGWNWDRFSAGTFFGGVVACGAGAGAGISSIINAATDD